VVSLKPLRVIPPSPNFPAYTLAPQQCIAVYHTQKQIHIPDPLQGRVGTPAVCATMDEAILSPRAHIALSGGPMKARPYL